MLNQAEIQEFFKARNDAGNGLGILEEAAKLLKKRSSIPRKVHQYKELFLKYVQAEKEYNKTPSDENKKILDDLSVEVAKKKIEVDELLHFFGMKNFLQESIGNHLKNSGFKRSFDISKEINAEYEKRRSPFELEVERLLEAKKGIYPEMKRCISAINDILISLSPKMHKDLMKEAIAYKEQKGSMGDYYHILIMAIEYRLGLLAGKECIGIGGLRGQYYNQLFIDSPYSYDRSYVLEEAKELLPLFLHPDQFCDLAMIAPELRDEIKLKYNEKYKDDEKDKDFDERCLKNIENKVYKLSSYDRDQEQMENPNVFTKYEGTRGINEHSLGPILTELKNNPVNNEKREKIVDNLLKHFPDKWEEIERHRTYPVKELFTEKIKNEQILVKGLQL